MPQGRNGMIALRVFSTGNHWLQQTPKQAWTGRDWIRTVNAGDRVDLGMRGETHSSLCWSMNLIMSLKEHWVTVMLSPTQAVRLWGPRVSA